MQNCGWIRLVDASEPRQSRTGSFATLRRESCDGYRNGGRLARRGHANELILALLFTVTAAVWKRILSDPAAVSSAPPDGCVSHTRLTHTQRFLGAACV